MLKKAFKENLEGAGSLLLAALLYAFYSILSRALGFKLPLFYGAFARESVCAVIVGIPFLLRLAKWKKVKQADYPWIIVRGIAGFMAGVSLFVTFLYLPVGTALFLLYAASTISSYFFGAVLFKEKISSLKGLSLILALGGLFFIYRLNFNPKLLPYSGLAILAGVTTSIWNVFSKKISHKYDALQLNFLDFVFAAGSELIVSLLLREQWVIPQMNSAWMANLGISLLFILTGQLILVGFKHIEAQIGSLISLSEILFGIILAYFFFQETISIHTLLGGILIITAIVLPELSFLRSKKALSKN